MWPWKNTHERADKLARELADAKRDARRRIKRWRKSAQKAEEEARALRSVIGADPFDASRLLWIFGTGRSGTTWLSSMLGALPGAATWDEPLVGYLFGATYYERATERKRESVEFILSGDGWLPSGRRFLLSEVARRFPGAGMVVVKEPNASIGAPLLCRMVPESRVIVVLRDPRDTVASALDARTEGGWKARQRGVSLEPDHVVHAKAQSYLRDVGNSLEGYRSHEGPKAILRYEELCADTYSVFSAALLELGVPFDEEDLRKVVERNRFEAIPEEMRGKGKFYRKATPGGWREDLTEEQVRVVEEITRPLLEEFYPES